MLIDSAGLRSIESELRSLRTSRRELIEADTPRAGEDTGGPLRNACSGSRDAEIFDHTSAAAFSPIFGYSFSTRFHASSSRVFVTIFRYVITSLMCACS